MTLFISAFNQLDAQNLFHNKFYFMPLHVSSTTIGVLETCRDMKCGIITSIGVMIPEAV